MADVREVDEPEAVTTETTVDISELEELARSLLRFRDTFYQKRMMLWSRAAGRTKWQKGLYIVAGLIALFSGGAITSVVTTLTSSTAMKVIAATLAFVSGIVSLVTTNLFDPKETEKMFDGAAQYAAARDRAQSIHDRRRSLSLGQIGDALTRLRTDSNKLSRDYDRLLPNLIPSQAVPLLSQR